MIDPTKITNFDRSIEELEELLLFCIAVAGKNATTTAKNLDYLLDFGRDFSNGSPFEIIRCLSQKYDLAELIKSFGFGCYSTKSKGFIQISYSKLDLNLCTTEDLEKIHGIGMKTSRFFVLHTRKNANVACLDTHILQWLSKHSGVKVPKQTPTRNKYLELERMFLDVSKSLKIHPADLDLKIWNMSRGRNEKLLATTSQ